MRLVVGIGQVVLDETIHLSQELQVGGKFKPSSITYSIGGPVASALIFLQNMGMKTIFFTSLAKDRQGHKIMRLFKRKNISIFPTYQSKTQRNIVLIHPSGQRTVIKDPWDSKAVLPDKKILPLADMIVFDRHQSHCFDEIITYRRPGCLLIFDPSTEVSLRNLLILKQLRYPIVPVEFVLRYKNADFEKNLRDLLQFLKKDLIITLGEFGSVVAGEDGIKFFPAYDIRAVDVLGAGDVFRAAFGYAILQRKSLEEAVDFANMISALQCLRKGNSSAIPKQEEIRNFSFSRKNISLKYVLSEIRKI